MGYVTYFNLEIREAPLPDMVTAAIKDFRTDSEGAEPGGLSELPSYFNFTKGDKYEQYLLR